jgi:hypothetical protein
LFEFAHNAIAFGGSGINGNKVVVVQIDAESAKFTEFLHRLDRTECRSRGIAEGIASPITDCP